jgi:hypothetical protein
MLELILGGILVYNLFFSDDTDEGQGDQSAPLTLTDQSIKMLDSYKGTDADAFLSKLVAVAGAIPVDPNALVGIIYEESRFNPKAYNSTSGASGLLQFMPATMTQLGTSSDAILAMDGISQLDYVSSYFQYWDINSPYDLWFAVFFPAAIGQPDTYVLQTPTLSAALVAKDNPGIAKGKDQITVADAKAYIAPFISDS